MFVRAVGSVLTCTKQTVPVSLPIVPGSDVPPERAARLDALAGRLEGFRELGTVVPRASTSRCCRAPSRP